jgi:hypothetical protein
MDEWVVCEMFGISSLSFLFFFYGFHQLPLPFVVIGALISQAWVLVGGTLFGYFGAPAYLSFMFSSRLLSTGFRHVALLLFDSLGYQTYRSLFLSLIEHSEILFLVCLFSLLSFGLSAWVILLSKLSLTFFICVSGLVTPLLIVLSMNLLILTVDGLSLVFLGHYTVEYRHHQYLDAPFRFLRWLARICGRLPMIRVWVADLMAAQFTFWTACAALPFEVLSVILGDQPRGRRPVRGFNYFGTRLILGLIFFVSSLLGSAIVMAPLIMALVFEGLVILFYLVRDFGILDSIIFFSKLILAFVCGPLHVLVPLRRSFFLEALRPLILLRRSLSMPPLTINGRPLTVDGSYGHLSNDDLKLLVGQVFGSFRSGMWLLVVWVLVVLSLLLAFLRFLRSVLTFAVYLPISLVRSLMFFFLAFLMPDVFFDLFYGVLQVVIWRSPWFLKELHRWSRALGLSVFYGLSYASTDLDFVSRRGGGTTNHSDLPRLNQLFVRTWVNLTRRSVIRFVEALDNYRIPEMIQAAYKPPSLDSIRSTYVTLQGLGFPVDQSFIDSLDRPESSSYLAEWGSWKNWLLGTSNFALGYRPVRLSFRNFLPESFYPQYPGYHHAADFTGLIEELVATARYWTGNHLIVMEDDDFDALVDDTWEAVKVQYADSRLLSPGEIYKNWVKKYNMGFGFGRQSQGRLRQLNRSTVIEIMGGKKKFLEAWSKVFKIASSLTMPSPVFTKWETLKLKKKLSRSVRTVVGSAFAHHVMTTIFNYAPNHNYHPWENPSKVGMPINGRNFNKLWESLAPHTFVTAGDATAFDSSQSQPMLRLCAEIRKRGFKGHQDYHRICELIDLAYDHLITQPLGFKNFGDIAFKAQGATTGHSSTTPDNTIMLIANYLFSWRAVTGLRAREFFNYNTLANFGDDHVLGWDPVFGWSPQKGWEAMKRLGTIMRDEAPGQDYLPLKGLSPPPGVKDWRDAKFSFLSKKPLPLSPEIVSELKAAGISLDISFATCHDRERLLGKIKGKVLHSKASNLKATYEALLGYMSLTAHHHDIYTELAKTAVTYYLARRRQVLGTKVKVQPPPSYREVLRAWYDGEVKFLPEDSPMGDDLDLELSVFTTPDHFGLFVRWLSDFPTLLSPRYRNLRWADWIQNKLSRQLSWPLAFIAIANGSQFDPAQARLLAARTPYAFLRSDLLIPSPVPNLTFGVLAFRHYIFMLYLRVFNARKYFTPLDLFRLLDAFWINSVFILTGRVSQSVVELDLHILDTILIFLLSYLHFELPFGPFPYFIPTPTDFVAQAFTRFVSYFSPSGSIDLQPVRAALERLMSTPSNKFVLDAPTGTGKSTRMVNFIQTVVRRPVIVIVPRRLICIGVGSYMQSLYPQSGICIGTEGHSPDPNFRILYTTVQYLFLHPSLRRPDSFYVCDEAHVAEPHYVVLMNYLLGSTIHSIFMTATPTETLNTLPLVKVPAVNNFSVVTGEPKLMRDFKVYQDFVVSFCNERTSIERILVFLPTLKMLESVAARLFNKSCFLSSKHDVIDESASVFLSTSVADAGITIPDVSIVITTNLDIAVLNDGKFISYFVLPRHILLQRRGRTGRTSNGVFIEIHLSDEITNPVAYTFGDFLSMMRPAVQQSLPFFPKEFLKDRDEFEVATLVYFDQKHSFPTFDLWLSHLGRFNTMHASKSLAEKLEILQTIKDDKTVNPFVSLRPFPFSHQHASLKTIDAAPVDDLGDFGGLTDSDLMSGMKFTITSDQSELALARKSMGAQILGSSPEAAAKEIFPRPLVALGVDTDTFVKRTARLKSLASKISPTLLRGPLDPFETPQWGGAPVVSIGTSDQVLDSDVIDVPELPEFQRVDVSGVGLLCGARVVQGLVYTHAGYVPNLSDVVSLIHDLTEPSLLTQYSTFFEWSQLREVLEFHFGIQAQLIHDGEVIPFPSGGRMDELAYAVIFLDAGHYNYLGLPLP